MRSPPSADVDGDVMAVCRSSGSLGFFAMVKGSIYISGRKALGDPPLRRERDNGKQVPLARLVVRSAHLLCGLVRFLRRSSVLRLGCTLRRYISRQHAEGWGKKKEKSQK